MKRWGVMLVFGLMTLAAAACGPKARGNSMYSIGVTGMTCGGCAKSVETTLKHLPGVSAAAVDLEAAKARVTVNAGVALTKEQVAKALDDAGFGLSAFEAK